jgi:phenolic acid decarboxylase
MYIKNATTIDYHVISGDVGGRIVKGQSVDLVLRLVRLGIAASIREYAWR